MNPSERPRVIVALDFANPMRALGLAERLDPHDCGLKVGKELFVTAGPDPVRWMVARGFNVFLDLKFHDIPNTVAQACAAATRLGVWMLNVHAAGGRPMLKAARDAVAATAAEVGVPRPLLVAVTVLTSLDQAALHETGIDLDAGRHVLRLAALARDCGLDGIVCSAVEAPSMRSAFGPDFALVTPGIRPAGSVKDDQTRIATPEMAAQGGANYLVVGRPITAAADPIAALAEINASLGNPA
ncbi:MAG TPA: orotidine-5'-phosphate decarboxylase [Casimicrobiaceae bacterium]|jgi:orotidine-5'-phosphate decarboxylase|nr:orotidine-5'-phosphate decarboxylase [Casimicrobiaceae bacterium]